MLTLLISTSRIVDINNWGTHGHLVDFTLRSHRRLSSVSVG